MKDGRPWHEQDQRISFCATIAIPMKAYAYKWYASDNWRSPSYRAMSTWTSIIKGFVAMVAMTRNRI